MRVRINIDFEVPPRVKRALKVGVPVAIVLAGGVVWANVPNTFKDGDLLSAQTMNDNFTALDTRLAKLEAVTSKASLDGGYTFGATYCGSTATTIADMSNLGGSGNGYARARSQCTVTCTNPGAHMCTSEEVVHSAELNLAIPAGWYSSGAYFSSSAPGNECSGWTVGTGTSSQAAVWNGGPSADYCNTTHPVLCCD